MTESQFWEQIQQARFHIQSQMDFTPEIGLILGSGFGSFADVLDGKKEMSYNQIPHFPLSTVEGHEGQLVAGTVKGRPVVVMKGRFHLYEGYSAREVAFPVWVMKQLGVRTLIVTNAAGGLNVSFRPGDLMLIRDQINFMFANPLIGPNEERLGVRFPDMSQTYSSALREAAMGAARDLGIQLAEGVYCGMLGPTYETPAEVRMLQFLGADAVGMSTVPEVIAARHSGMEVLGISCITNMAAGILPSPLSHDEVLETTAKVRDQFVKLLVETIPRLP